ncbi:MAG: SlyX family protein [Rhodospirillales bacterium]|nr:SlyX family protein [Rhodospirillales bacterium]
MSEKMNAEERISELEIKIAYQEDQIEELNKSLYDHWKLIEKLSRNVEILTERVKSAAQQEGAQQPDNQPPPHY